MTSEIKTITIDPDTVTMVLTDAEHTPHRSRAAIDEIATRVEAELQAQGIKGVEVEREYRTTGRRDDASDFHREIEAVVVGQVGEIRAAVLGIEVTVEQLRALRDEAATAGDFVQALLCDLAIKGDQVALAKCESVIRNAQAQT